MRLMMKQTMPILLLLIFFAGCGGGGGEYYPPLVDLNPFGIKKEPFTYSDVGQNEKIEIAGLERDDTANDRSIEGCKYYYFREITFNGEGYTLAIPIDNWVSIINSEGKVIAKLKTPRYSRDAVAVELRHSQHKSFLAVFIDQQSSSHTSTLYILDSDLKTIYKEHLLGAHWIAKKESPGGDFLFVSSEDKWRPNDEWVTIGGNWKYNIFESIS